MGKSNRDECSTRPCVCGPDRRALASSDPLRTLRSATQARFNPLKRSVLGISQKTPTQCLRQLERSGLDARRVLTDSPLGVEYSFTQLGETLEPPFTALYKWTRQYSAAVRTAAVARNYFLLCFQKQKWV